MSRRMGLFTVIVGVAILLSSVGLSVWSSAPLPLTGLESIYGAADGDCDIHCKAKASAGSVCYSYGGDYCRDHSDCDKSCSKLYNMPLVDGSGDYYRELQYCTVGYDNVCIGGYCEDDYWADCGTYYDYWAC